MPLIGYARISTENQPPLSQSQALKTAGCADIHEEQASGANPNITLQAICDRLQSMRQRTPRGRTSWQPSSVRMLLERAERLALL